MSPVPRPTLLAITAHARAGALEHAWRLFRQAGLEGSRDPAALALKGRLLKDRARAAEGAAQPALYREAAQAYEQAAVEAQRADAQTGRTRPRWLRRLLRAVGVRTPRRRGGVTYPLINAASLFLLAGEAERARGRAEAVLTSLAHEPDETPYWRAATRAEALLVLGRTDDAKAALAEALARAPRAWEDHASTLGQLGLILAARREDAGWLEPLRPPRALHFAGHMALAAEDQAAAEQARAMLQRERVGFGYGALAAGADIVIAEALLAHRAELHLVLPVPAEAFREASVARFGGDWPERFDRLIAEAASVRVVGGAPEATHPLAVQLATEVAMGEAVMKAQALNTEALQLVVLESATTQDGAPGSSAWARATWAASARRQEVIVAARAGGRARSRATADSTRLAALLAAEVATAEALAAVRRGVTGEGRWAGGVLHLAYPTPEAAAAAARWIARETGAAVAGHYGLAAAASVPFGGGEILLGAAAALPPAILGSTPPGAIHLSETFAAALQARAADLRTEYVGTLPQGADEVALHALRA